MDKLRSRLIVEIDLDPVPGWGNQPSDHANYLRELLQGVSHYNPTVEIDPSCEGQDPTAHMQAQLVELAEEVMKVKTESGWRPVSCIHTNGQGFCPPCHQAQSAICF